MSGPLVSAGELAGRLGDDSLVILDVRWRLLGPRGLDDYRSGHLPDARFVDLDSDLAADPNEHGRHPLPKAEAFQSSMRRLGVNLDSQVVCYDERDATSAARAWWLLRYFGHPRVAVLDGGYDAWVGAGLPVSVDIPEPVGGDFVASPGGLALVDADGAARLAVGGVLLDARAAERYAGRHEPVDAVAGHIPGAVSAPTSANVLADGRFRAGSDLRGEFERLGVSDAVPVGAYCGSGVTAAQQILALELAGFSAALYADSWSGWITDPLRPVATDT